MASERDDKVKAYALERNHYRYWDHWLARGREPHIHVATLPRAALDAGESGIRTVTRFPIDGLMSTMAGTVDFVTSPGFLRGGTTRRDGGLPTGGMYRVVTDFGIFGFDDETKRMNIIALHPGVTLGQVQDNTGFELAFEPGLEVTERPTERELDVLRKLDPARLYTA